MADRIIDTSKFLSFVLRHRPETIGIALDTEGWTDIAGLIAAAARSGRRLDRALIDTVVRTNDKQRFLVSADGLRIRAAQGHSTRSVQLQHREVAPPAFLYHGTASRFLDAILQQGLKPGSRHHVHLSPDFATARAVGRRHGRPVVLRVDAAAMAAQGFAFFLSENGVWLTAAVPPAFLHQLADPA